MKILFIFVGISLLSLKIYVMLYFTLRLDETLYVFKQKLCKIS